MSRSFSFDIKKPKLITDGGDPLQGRLISDLTTKYPLSGPSDEQYPAIITFLYPSPSEVREIKFDRGFSRNTAEKVLVARFGDGYEQRVRDGINSKRESFAMNLTNRNWQEIVLISSYFDVIQPASFDIRLERETIKVALDNYSIQIGHDTVQSITAQMRRVYVT